MKIYLVAPKNPESFWTFDRILSSLKINAQSPTFRSRRLRPSIRGYPVGLCDENVEPVRFDTEADIVGLTDDILFPYGRRRHTKTVFQMMAETHMADFVAFDRIALWVVHVPYGR